MSIEFARDFLFWSFVVNYGVLLGWFLAFVIGHDWMLRLHGRWFRLSEEHFDSIHYAGMALYKVGVLLFNVAPYVALRILMSHGSQ